MSRRDALLSLVDQFYGAALDPTRWPETLMATATHFGAVAAALELHSKHGEPPFLRDSGLPPDGIEAYLAYYHSVCPRLRPEPEGGLSYDYKYLTEREMDRDEFYADFLAVDDLRYYLHATVVDDRSSRAILGVHRTRRQGHVEQAEMDMMERLVPHLRRAIEIQTRLARADATDASLRQLASSLRAGAILLDGRGSVVFINDEAARVIARGDVLQVFGTLLRARRPRDRTALDALVASALPTADRGSGACGGRMALRGEPGRAAVGVLVTPLCRADSGAGARTPPSRVPYGAMVVLTDASRSNIPARDLVAEVFGLTSAESRLAVALSEGRSIAEHAAMEGVTVHTARTHVANVRSKLGVRSQAEVVQRLMALLPPVADSGADN